MSQPADRPTGPRINVRGAVDLSSLTRAAAAPGASTGAAAGAVGGGQAGAVVDLTEANFQAVLGLSAQVPLIVVFSSSASPASTEVATTLESLVLGHGGRLVLARVDFDAQPQLAAAFRVQGVPTVMAVIAGQPVPLFSGQASREQIAGVLDQVLQLASENGINGSVGADQSQAEQSEAPETPTVPPHLQAAEDALAAGDLGAAVAAFETAVKQNPADAEAKSGLARAQFLQRVNGIDQAQARARAAADPKDVAAQLDAADLEIYGGNLADGFNRLIDTVRITKEAEREQVRSRVVALFDVVGADHEAVVKARRLLSAALF